MCTCLFLLCPSGLWFLMWFARVSLRTWTRSACGSRTASRCRPSRPPSRYWPRSFCGYHQALSSLDNLYTTRDSVLIVMADFDHAAAYRRHRFWLEEEVWRCRRGRGARRGEGGDIRPLLFDPIFFFALSAAHVRPDDALYRFVLLLALFFSLDEAGRRLAITLLAPRPPITFPGLLVTVFLSSHSRGCLRDASSDSRTGTHWHQSNK
jgi:hypothetical protein